MFPWRSIEMFRPTTPCSPFQLAATDCFLNFSNRCTAASCHTRMGSRSSGAAEPVACGGGVGAVLGGSGFSGCGFGGATGNGTANLGIGGTGGTGGFISRGGGTGGTGGFISCGSGTGGTGGFISCGGGPGGTGGLICRAGAA